MPCSPGVLTGAGVGVRLNWAKNWVSRRRPGELVAQHEAQFENVYLAWKPFPLRGPEEGLDFTGNCVLGSAVPFLDQL